MDFRCIKAVAMVAKHLNFSEAAFELNYSTSAVSKQIAAFEKEVGFTVFQRSTKSAVLLTDEGVQIMPHVRSLLDEGKWFWDKVDCIKHARDNRLVISFAPNVSSLNIEQFIAQFSVKFPEIKISIRLLSDIEAWQQIKQGRVDVFATALPGDINNPALFEGYFSPEELRICPYEQCQTCIAIGTNNPLSKKEVILFSDLKDARIIHRKFADSPKNRELIRVTRKALAGDGQLPDFEFIDDEKGTYTLDLIENSGAVMPMLRLQNIPGRSIVVRTLENPNANRLTLCLISLIKNTSQSMKNFISIVKTTCANSGRPFYGD